tara:strand:+ start:133 stop:465 length:333 start_codon:yes stop_codon:yes gene_type:complete
MEYTNSIVTLGSLTNPSNAYAMQKGVRIKSNGKREKLIPWSSIKKHQLAKGVYRLESKFKGDNLNLYMARKTINNVNMTGLYNTERECYKAIDLFLIKNGKEPKFILKKL